MSIKNQTIAPRFAAIVAVSIAFALMSGCSDKADKAADDVAAIRAMMEKKEADLLSAEEKSRATLAEMRAKHKASR
jgi:outer membrane murein-binding lipoprotein Lpp